MKLPLLEHRQAELESCAFCPKLSRAACPVSNADGRETTTPWGKMSAAFMLSRGAIEATQEQAFPPWACTGCFACKQACDLRNDVAGTLLDARADLTAAGLAPDRATEAIARHEARTAAADEGLAEARARAVERGAAIDEASAIKVVVGCMNARDRASTVAADAIYATSKLVGAAVGVVPGCCGAPLRMAGDREGFVRAARSFVEKIAGARTIVVADAGCAHAIKVRYAEVGATLPASMDVVHLVELAAARLPAIPSLSEPNGAPRYHDACALGRGLGVYEPPRALLARLFGRPPEEFARAREQATCAGGGGLLPVTYAENARAIAEGRVGQHRDEGGGAIATTCASSARSLRKAGADVVDLATLLARAIEGARSA